MRLALAALLCLAVLGGCGSDDGPRKTNALGGGLGTEVTSKPDPPVSGEAVTWRITVENNGVQAVDLTFGSSQRAEVTLRRDGKEVYKWSTGRFFATAVHEERLRPNRTLDYELETKELRVKPGKYELVARLTAKPPQEPARRTITVKK